MTNVSKFYMSVINDVIGNVKDDFSEEGVEEQVLQELKKVWEQKLSETRALDHETERINSIPASQYSQLLFRTHTTNSGQGVSTNSTGVAVASGTSNLKQQTYHPVSLGQIQRGQVITGAAQAAQTAAAMTVPTVYQPHAQGAVSRGVVTLTAAGGHYIAVPAGQILAHAAVPSMTVSGSAPQSSSSISGQAGVASQLQTFKQMDGADGSSSDDDDDDDDEDEFTGLAAAGGPSTTLTMEGDDDEDDLLGSGEGEEGSGGPKEEEEPLNSGDDVSDEETEQLFDTENVVVCQYDKITRCRNRWKFHLKDGIMTISGKDHVFQKAVGDAEW